MSLINENLIQINSTLEDKNLVINEIAEILYKDRRTCNKEGLIQDIFKREEEVSTALGLGVAIPHAHSEHVREPSLVFIKLLKPISWGSNDDVKIVFGIANPLNNNNNNHLKILATLARQLMDDEFRNKLISIESRDEALKILGFLNENI